MQDSFIPVGNQNQNPQASPNPHCGEPSPSELHRRHCHEENQAILAQLEDDRAKGVRCVGASK